jgi:hypothetical protein
VPHFRKVHLQYYPPVYAEVSQVVSSLQAFQVKFLKLFCVPHFIFLDLLTGEEYRLWKGLINFVTEICQSLPYCHVVVLLSSSHRISVIPPCSAALIVSVEHLFSLFILLFVSVGVWSKIVCIHGPTIEISVSAP